MSDDRDRVWSGSNTETKSNRTPLEKSRIVRRAPAVASRGERRSLPLHWSSDSLAKCFHGLGRMTARRHFGEPCIHISFTVRVGEPLTRCESMEPSPADGHLLQRGALDGLCLEQPANQIGERCLDRHGGSEEKSLPIRSGAPRSPVAANHRFRPEFIASAPPDRSSSYCSCGRSVGSPVHCLPLPRGPRRTRSRSRRFLRFA